MPEFAYSAMNQTGQAVTGTVQADTRPQGIASLAETGVFVTQMDEVKSAAQRSEAAPWWRWRAGGGRISRRAHLALLRQMAVALQSGLPLLGSLRTVQQQAQHQALEDLVGDLADRVQRGESLSEAMRANPRHFTPLEAAMTRVGETAGILDEVMVHLSDFAERDMEVREQMRSAAAYPIFVLCLAAVSVIIVLTWVLPRIMETVFEHGQGYLLPWPTRLLMGVSDFLLYFGWAAALVLVAAGWAFRRWISRPDGRLAFDRFKLRVPVLGTALRRVAVARFARTLGTLFRSGIEIVEAMQVLRGTLGNEALARQIDAVTGQIVQGHSIAEPLRRTGQFPPLLIQVIAMGERTGRIDELLLQTASSYEKESAAALQRVMTILPAAIIVLLALLIGFIVAAVLLPIVSMHTAVTGM